MSEKHSMKYRFLTCFAVIIGILSLFDILYRWSPHFVEYFSLSQVYPLAFSAWVIAVAGVLFFTLHTLSRRLHLNGSSLSETIHLTWFMAPIVNTTVSLLGNSVLNMTITLYPDWALLIFIINGVFVGIGFILFNLIGGVIFVRIAHKTLPSIEMISFFGILLGAVGLMICVMSESAENAQLMGLLSSTGSFYLFACLFWGVGFWIMGFILILCLHQLYKRKTPLRIEWGIFIFSLQVYTIASQKIAAYFISPLTTSFTKFLMIILIVFWLTIFANAVHKVVWGKRIIGEPPHMESNHSVK